MTRTLERLVPWMVGVSIAAFATVGAAHADSLEQTMADEREWRSGEVGQVPGHSVNLRVSNLVGFEPMQQVPEEEPEDPLFEPEEPEREDPLREDPLEPEPVPPEFAAPPELERPPHLITPDGMAVSVGGGVMNFIDGDMREFTDVAGTWEARVVYGTRSLLAAEVAYIGTAQGINAIGLDPDANLLGTGFEAVGRINSMLIADLIQPYAFAGIGVTRYDIINADFNQSNFGGEETVGHIPLGVGVGLRWTGFILDLRGTVRPAFGDSFLVDDDIDQPGADNWTVAAQVGWEF